ncbi:hypothetical protein JAAARDRAFT_62468 [Jaapia argillacea MUCL 33604]|uniref:Uncharacterized protein n=1 Tax=Jaapia argillacea MUCL 33604 TaxID=933084 RepID=A0A067PCN4_9AGAM|nr:hypothetical protein JAAARDRAFT_62468 [Jaapia argillacea MUCL 33604]
MYTHRHADSSDLGDTSHPGFPGAMSIFPRKGGGGRGSSHSSGSKGGGSSSHVQLGSHTGMPSGKTVSAYSAGGGKSFTLGSSSPFSGRLAGGGTRSQVFGNSRYGSGYPYGSYGTYIDDRPLPYVFYPVPIYPNYYGSDTYTNFNETQRPGGNITIAVLRAPSLPNTTEIYRIVGDQLSTSAVLDALVTDCNVQNTTLSPFNASDGTDSWPLPEQIVQWYRASSFGLSLDSYNNTAALPSNMPPSNDSLSPPLSDDTPLPTDLNTTYLSCLNKTIGASVPLVDPPYKPSAAMIVLFVFAGIVILWCAVAAIYNFALACVPLLELMGDLWSAIDHWLWKIRDKHRRRQYSTVEETDWEVGAGS